MAVAFIEKKCTGCGECVSVCSHAALTVSGEVRMVNAKACVECGACITMCSSGALDYEWNGAPTKAAAEHAFARRTAPRQ
jgi:ferredoxin